MACFGALKAGDCVVLPHGVWSECFAHMAVEEQPEMKVLATTGARTGVLKGCWACWGVGAPLHFLPSAILPSSTQLPPLRALLPSFPPDPPSTPNSPYHLPSPPPSPPVLCIFKIT